MVALLAVCAWAIYLRDELGTLIGALCWYSFYFLHCDENCVHIYVSIKPLGLECSVLCFGKSLSKVDSREG